MLSVSKLFDLQSGRHGALIIIIVASHQSRSRVRIPRVGRGPSMCSLHAQVLLTSSHCSLSLCVGPVINCRLDQCVSTQTLKWIDVEVLKKLDGWNYSYWLLVFVKKSKTNNFTHSQVTNAKAHKL